jgi:oligoendopeptidase F
VEKLAWFDLIAPVASDESAYSWEGTENFIETTFGRYSEKLARFARRSFEENGLTLRRASAKSAALIAPAFAQMSRAF